MNCRFGLVLFFGLTAAACATIGPQANVTLVNSELKAQKSYEAVLVADLMANPKVDDKVEKAILASATSQYGKKARSQASIAGMIQKAGTPKNFPDVMWVAYQAEFNKVVDEYNKAAAEDPETKAPEKMELPVIPKSKTKAPEDLKGVKKFAKRLKKDSALIDEIASKADQGDFAGAKAKFDGSPVLATIIDRVDQFVFKQMNTDYLLLTSITGGESEYNAGKDITVTAAMVNVKTGHFRYFAQVKDKKGSVPTPYVAYVGGLSNALFTSISEKEKAGDKPTS